MSGDDDPEARIRELERALTEQSAELTRSSSERASTGSTGRHTPPPAVAAQPSTAATGGSGWIRYGVMAVVLVAFVGGIVVYAVNAFSSGSSDFGSNGGSNVGTDADIVTTGPTAAGGGPSGTSEAPTTIVLEPAGGTLDVPVVGAHETIACNDGNVSISGARNVVVITGQCASVTVSGMENSVAVNSSVQISASGMNNRVTYLSGTPEIGNSGISNTVERG